MPNDESLALVVSLEEAGGAAESTREDGGASSIGIGRDDEEGKGEEGTSASNPLQHEAKLFEDNEDQLLYVPHQPNKVESLLNLAVEAVVRNGPRHENCLNVPAEICQRLFTLLSVQQKLTLPHLQNMAENGVKEVFLVRAKDQWLEAVGTRLAHSLRKLVLLTCMASDVAFQQLVQSAHNLESLHLDRCFNFTDNAFEGIGKKNGTLKALCLRRMNITAQAFEHLKELQGLERLKISRINATPAQLFSFLTEHMRHVRMLDISRNDIVFCSISEQTNISQELANLIIPSSRLTLFSNLVTLDISGNMLCQDWPFANVFSKLSQLQNLYISDLLSTPLGFEPYFFEEKFLPTLPKRLTVLDISKNPPLGFWRQRLDDLLYRANLICTIHSNISEGFYGSIGGSSDIWCVGESDSNIKELLDALKVPRIVATPSILSRLLTAIANILYLMQSKESKTLDISKEEMTEYKHAFLHIFHRYAFHGKIITEICAIAGIVCELAPRFSFDVVKLLGDGQKGLLVRLILASTKAHPERCELHIAAARALHHLVSSTPAALQTLREEAATDKILRDLIAHPHLHLAGFWHTLRALHPPTATPQTPSSSSSSDVSLTSQSHEETSPPPTSVWAPSLLDEVVRGQFVVPLIQLGLHAREDQTRVQILSLLLALLKYYHSMCKPSSAQIQALLAPLVDGGLVALATNMQTIDANAREIVTLLEAEGVSSSTSTPTGGASSTASARNVSASSSSSSFSSSSTLPSLLSASPAAMSNMSAFLSRFKKSVTDKLAANNPFFMEKKNNNTTNKASTDDTAEAVPSGRSSKFAISKQERVFLLAKRRMRERDQVKAALACPVRGDSSDSDSAAFL
jgi:hypothetical protein